MELLYAFTLFFITLGPLKIIPAFYHLSLGLEGKDIRAIAWKGTLYSIIIILSVALISNYIINAWKISLTSFILAGGIILFLSSLEVINSSRSGRPDQSNQPKESLDPKKIHLKALSPVAIPLIISPVGIVAVLSVVISTNGIKNITGIFIILSIIMSMNLLVMIFARNIIRAITLPVYSVIGWTFAVFQAGLAIQFIVNALTKLKVLN